MPDSRFPEDYQDQEGFEAGWEARKSFAEADLARAERAEARLADLKRLREECKEICNPWEALMAARAALAESESKE